MKKSIKFMLLILLCCPLLAFAACTPPATYSITAVPSDSTLGRVDGAFNLEKLAEGTTINLSVIENKPSTNPFICWVKDNKTVVETSKNITLTYSQSKAGNYTAVFDETSNSKMQYSSFSSISLDIEGFSFINYTLEYARTNSGSSDFTELEKSSFNNGQTYQTENKNLLYFGKAGENYEYKLRINFELITSADATTEFSYSFNTLINNKSFDNNGSFTIIEELDYYNTPITLTFNKLNKSMFEQQ